MYLHLHQHNTQCKCHVYSIELMILTTISRQNLWFDVHFLRPVCILHQFLGCLTVPSRFLSGCTCTLKALLPSTLCLKFCGDHPANHCPYLSLPARSSWGNRGGAGSAKDWAWGWETAESQVRHRQWSCGGGHDQQHCWAPRGGWWGGLGGRRGWRNRQSNCRRTYYKSRWS